MASIEGSPAQLIYRGATLRDVPLEDFFRPPVVAVIGASGSRGSATRLLYKTVKKKVENQGGTVHPVNPKRNEIDGVPCFPSISAVPGELDLVVIAAGDPVKLLEEAVEKRPKFVMVFAAGFAEAGEAGLALQENLARIARDAGVFLLGPNTTLNSFLPMRDDLSGKGLALISHSGHHGRHIWQGQELGIPISYWAPTGNEADLEFADFVRFFAEQSEVGAIAGYVEGFKDGRTLILAADYAMRRGVPIVLVKVGRSDLGRSMASSHTAHNAGSDVVTSAVFRQYGIGRVDTMDELLHAAAMLARSAAPRSDGVALYSISGGALAHLGDLAVAAGLRIPELSQKTQAALREHIPGYLRVSNPVDSGGGPSGDDRGKAILESLVADPEIGVVVIPFVANAYHLSDAVTEHALQVARSTDKPICLVWGSPSGDEATYQKLRKQGDLLVFRSFAQCIAALRSYFDYHALRRRYVSPLGVSTEPSLEAREVLDTVAPGQEIADHGTRTLLTAYGIEMLPVDTDQPPGGLEAAVGLTHDSVFGPTVRFGLVGPLSDLLGDLSYRVPPYSHTDALDMIRDLRGHALLRGAGGVSPVDTDSIADVLVAVGRLAHELGDELEVCEIRLLAGENRTVALDASLRAASLPAPISLRRREEIPFGS